MVNLMPTNLQTALKMLDEIPQAELRVFKAREIIREALASHEALSARVKELEGMLAGGKDE